jgi:hypothetical protein
MPVRARGVRLVDAPDRLCNHFDRGARLIWRVRATRLVSTFRTLPYDLVPASSSVRRSKTRVVIGVAINLLIAALHVLDLRALLGPELRPMIGSYFSDLTLPFAFYYLLCFIDDQAAILRPAAAKASVVLLASAGAEVLQAAGVPALGRTFDPADLVMYATGVGLAATLGSLPAGAGLAAGVQPGPG